MTALSATFSQPSRKLAQVLLQRIASVKNETIACAIHKDPSTVSRIVSGEAGIRLDDLECFLCALEMKVVGINQICVDKNEFAAYRALAAKFLEKPSELDWGDGQ